MVGAAVVMFLAMAATAACSSSEASLAPKSQGATNDVAGGSKVNLTVEFVAEQLQRGVIINADAQVSVKPGDSVTCDNGQFRVGSGSGTGVQVEVPSSGGMFGLSGTASVSGAGVVNTSTTPGAKISLTSSYEWVVTPT